MNLMGNLFVTHILSGIFSFLGFYLKKKLHQQSIEQLNMTDI
jgi:hypothetical protein